jgi:hypothetical protein
LVRWADRQEASTPARGHFAFRLAKTYDCFLGLQKLHSSTAPGRLLAQNRHCAVVKQVFFDTPTAGSKVLHATAGTVYGNPVAMRYYAETLNKKFPHMLIGHIRVCSKSGRQTTDLQRDALLGMGVDARHLFEDHAAAPRMTDLAW